VHILRGGFRGRGHFAPTPWTEEREEKKRKDGKREKREGNIQESTTKRTY